MFKDLWTIFSVKRTSQVNALQYYLRRIPLIKRLFKGSSYALDDIKLIWLVASTVWEFIKDVFGKVFYTVMIVMAALLMSSDLIPDSANLHEGAAILLQPILHIIIFLSLIGSQFNNGLFQTGEDEYCGVLLLRFDAKKYALVNYFYFLAKTVVMQFVVLLIPMLICGINPLYGLLAVGYILGIKLLFSGLAILRHKSGGILKFAGARAERTLENLSMIAISIAGCVLAACNILIPIPVIVVIMLCVLIAGLLCIIPIIRYDRFAITYKRELYDYKFGIYSNNVKANNAEKNMAFNALNSESASEDKSNKTGLAFLNEMTIKRHKKVLWKPSIYISIGAAALIVICLGLMFFIPELKAELFQDNIMHIIPTLVFIMYIINRGLGFTQVLFINCDHSFLTYSFYKKPRLILKLFTMRLVEIIKINLLPAVTIGAGLDLIMFASGGTGRPLDYVVLMVSVVALSIFFSVHYLTIYYLLQPYNANTEMKSPLYGVIKYLTYLFSYLIMINGPESDIFGIATVAFCIIYCIVACILVYKLAPKTFKIKN